MLRQLGLHMLLEAEAPENHDQSFWRFCSRPATVTQTSECQASLGLGFGVQCAASHTESQHHDLNQRSQVHGAALPAEVVRSDCLCAMTTESFRKDVAKKLREAQFFSFSRLGLRTILRDLGFGLKTKYSSAAQHLYRCFPFSEIHPSSSKNPVPNLLPAQAS